VKSNLPALAARSGIEAAVLCARPADRAPNDLRGDRGIYRLSATAANRASTRHGLVTGTIRGAFSSTEPSAGTHSRRARRGPTYRGAPDSVPSTVQPDRRRRRTVSRHHGGETGYGRTAVGAQYNLRFTSPVRCRVGQRVQSYWDPQSVPTRDLANLEERRRRGARSRPRDSPMGCPGRRRGCRRPSLIQATDVSRHTSIRPMCRPRAQVFRSGGPAGLLASKTRTRSCRDRRPGSTCIASTR